MSIERLIKAFELEKKILGIVEKKYEKSLIEQAEQILDVKFPPTYRYYLEHIHWATKTPIHGVEGNLETGLSPHCTLISETLRERSKKVPLPDKHIFIENDGPDTWYILNTLRVNENGECPVICWLGGTYFDSPYADFDGLYLELVNGAIYDMMMDKAEEEELTRQEVEDYIEFYKSLGFTGEEYKFLQQNWAALLEEAQ